MAKRSGVGLALPALVLAALIGRCGAGPQAKLDSSSSERLSTISKPAAISVQEAPAPAQPLALAKPARQRSAKPKAPLEESATPSKLAAGEPRHLDRLPGAQAKAPTPKDVARLKRQLVQDSIDQYSGSCPCPYNTARNGSSCGRRSAYSRPGGASPFCYPGDVPDSMVAAAWEAETRL
jgi:hypothetical protein